MKPLPVGLVLLLMTFVQARSRLGIGLLPDARQELAASEGGRMMLILLVEPDVRERNRLSRASAREG